MLSVAAADPLARSSSEKLMAWLGNGVKLAEELVEEQLEDDGGRGRGMVGCFYGIYILF
jgi:hypothetical protein